MERFWSCDITNACKAYTHIRPDRREHRLYLIIHLSRDPHFITE